MALLALAQQDHTMETETHPIFAAPPAWWISLVGNQTQVVATDILPTQRRAGRELRPKALLSRRICSDSSTFLSSPQSTKHAKTATLQECKEPPARNRCNSSAKYTTA
eukprot:596741-Amphidinium_carterae.1